MPWSSLLRMSDHINLVIEGAYNIIIIIVIIIYNLWKLINCWKSATCVINLIILCNNTSFTYMFYNKNRAHIVVM